MQNFDDTDEKSLNSKVFFDQDKNIKYMKVMKQGKYFVEDNDGVLVLPQGYDEILFANEVASNTFYSDKEKINDQVYSNQFSSDHIKFNKDLIIVKNNSRYGMFHTDGQKVLPVQYEKIIWISKDRIIVCKEGKYGISDTKGTCLIPCVYDKIRPIPFIKEYGYDYAEEYRQYGEEIKLIAAQSRGMDGYVETGFNMNGEMIIRPCLSITLGEYFSLMETWNEFPYIRAEVYTNLILEFSPRRYYFLNLKSIGFDPAEYMEECEDCIEYVCGKVVYT